MFHFPLSISAGADSIAVDAKGTPVICFASNDQARFVVDSLNSPASAFLAECKKRQALAFARGDAKEREFWQRLRGSVSKAVDLTT